MKITPSDRLLVIAAHPDDEVLGAGGVIAEAILKGARVKVIFMTYGEKNDISCMMVQKKFFLKNEDYKNYAKHRRAEALKAARILGLKDSDLFFAELPDRGVLKIAKSQKNKGLFSARLLKEILLFSPSVLILPSASDKHSDHRGSFLYFSDILSKDFLGKCHVYQYLVHGKNRWIKKPPANLARFLLSPKAQALKEKALEEYRSQLMLKKGFLRSFLGREERFSEYRF